jgi:hypothetical protein
MIHDHTVGRPKGPSVEIAQLAAGAELAPEPQHRLLNGIGRIGVGESEANREAIQILASSTMQGHDQPLGVLCGRLHNLGLGRKLRWHHNQ